MIEEVKLPEISENVESGDVVEVLVKVGDYVEKEQSLAELETEKAAFELPSPVKGKIVQINIKEGEQVRVGQVICKIDTEAEPAAQKKTEDKKKTVETDKTEMKEEPKAEPKKETGKKAAEKRQPPAVEPKEEAQQEQEAEQMQINAGPAVRQLARELGVDINKVTGSGSSGRISPEDVKEYAKNIIAGLPLQQPVKQTRALPDFTKWGDIERKSITITRKKIADTLSYTWSSIPQVTQYDLADITELEEFRREYSPQVEQAGGKLTITSILLKVATSVLQKFPEFNASFDPEKQEIIYKKYYNISVAIDTDRGLLVPVLRDVDKKSILQLSVELTELAEKTRQHKVTPEDMVGGNFTISNLGSLGGSNFAPIIYWPQVAILGVSRAGQKPVYIDGKFEPRLILPLSVSYDHRIIDGAQGLRFIRWVAETLEKPFLLASKEKIE